MTEIISSNGGAITQFDPAKTKIKLVRLDALAEYARKIQDWPLLEEAIDAKIKEQGDFCLWWLREVTPNLHAGKLVTERLPTKEDVAEWKMTVSRWRKRLETKAKYRAWLLGAEYKAALLSPADNHRAQGTGENEWYTPSQYVEAARKVLGEIDLDPATSEHGQKTIQAKHYFTANDNGLVKEWRGRVWLNPPYAQPLIWQFVQKLTDELKSGRVTDAILLTHSYTDTAWFHLAEEIAPRICWTRGRIKFIDQDGEECAPTQGQAFFYYGDEPSKFDEVFRQFGFIR